MTETAKSFANETLVFVQQLCSHLSGSLNATDTEEALTSIVAVLMQSPDDLARFIKAGTADFRLKVQNPAESEREPYTAMSLRIALRKSKGSRSKVVATPTNRASFLSIFETRHPELYWHLAKGKMSDAEPMYGALILRGEEEIGRGESDASAEAAFNIAYDNACLIDPSAQS